MTGKGQIGRMHRDLMAELLKSKRGMYDLERVEELLRMIDAREEEKRSSTRWSEHLAELRGRVAK